MADKDSLLQYVSEILGPQLQPLVDKVEEELAQDPDVTLEVLEEILANLEYVAENPDEYQSVIQAAISAGAIDPEDAPPEFDPAYVAIMILAIQELLPRLNKLPRFKRGGLAQLAKQGRGGDTMLAHINPKEAEVLKRMGGSGTVNPNTGLREFKGLKLGKVFKSVGKAVSKTFKAVSKVAKFALPMVANYFVPGSGMIVGALQGGMEGGFKGAVLGGLGGYLGGGGSGLAETIGNQVVGALPTSIGTSLAETLGAEALGFSLLGGASSALQGKNPLLGAVTAGALSKFSPQIGNALGKTGLGANYVTSGMNAANVAAQTGNNPLYGLAGGLMAQGATDLAGKFGFNGAQGQPSGDNTNAGTEYNPDYYNAQGQLTSPGSLESAGMIQDPSTGTYFPTSSPQGQNVLATTQNAGSEPSFMSKLLNNEGGESAGGSLFTGKNLLLGATALTALGGMTPQQALTQVDQSQMSPEQKAAMERGLTNYVAAWNPTILPTQGTPEYDAMMRYIQQGQEINFMAPSIATSASAPQVMAARGGRIGGYAKGGALSQLANLATGAGHGREDLINARLSDGEYVMDAETVALLGNGSTKAGAAALDKMRKELRQQKGKALAKGKFSPNAKSPLAYMKGGLK